MFWNLYLIFRKIVLFDSPFFTRNVWHPWNWIKKKKKKKKLVTLYQVPSVVIPAGRREGKTT